MKKLLIIRYSEPETPDVKKLLGRDTVRAIKCWLSHKGYLKALNTLEAVADDIGVSPGCLSCFFRVAMKKPFLSWRKELRIEEAMHLLDDNPDLPISMAGSLVGIEDKSNFKRQFKEVAGISPAEYRDKKGKNARIILSKY